MNKNTFKKIQLDKGKMYVYDFDAVRLHAYQTNDAINNQVFLVEKDGTAVLIEAPCFYDNEKELYSYIRANHLSVAGMLLAYHMAGADFMPGTRTYATKNAEAYSHQGGGKALIDNFASVFGNAFDNQIYTITDFIREGPVTIGGINFHITLTDEAFDIELPEIGCIYTHMLGHDCHSIVAGAAHADAIIAQLEGYLEKRYTLVLTSHYVPEDLKDAADKIVYLKKLKMLAEESGNAAAFKTVCKQAFPDYSGENYLDMTAASFFHE